MAVTLASHVAGSLSRRLSPNIHLGSVFKPSLPTYLDDYWGIAYGHSVECLGGSQRLGRSPPYLLFYTCVLVYLFLYAVQQSKLSPLHQ